MPSLFWQREYERKAGDPNPIVQSGRGSKYDTPTLLNEIHRAIHLLKLDETHTTLDVGCANGLFDQVIGACCKSVIGLEPVEALAKSARCNLTTVSNASIINARGEFIPLPSNSIDRALLAEVIQLNPPEIVHRILKETARVLKPIGRIVVLSVPDGRFRSTFESAYFDQLAQADHLTDSEKQTIARRHKNMHWHTVEELTKIAEDLGGMARFMEVPNCAPNSDHRFDLVIEFAGAHSHASANPVGTSRVGA